MATTTTFNDMLKKYMPYNLLKEEIEKRDYFLSKVEKDQKWKGGELQVPFRGGRASSMKFGGLKDVAEITENREILGTVSAYKEIWGAMVFNDSDLAKHDSMEQSFIKILPDQLDEFIDSMKETVSLNLLNGAHMDVTTAAGAVGSTVAVAHPERYQLGMYIVFDGGEEGYIESINMETKVIKLDSQIGLGGADVDLSGVASGEKIYIEGAKTAGFTGLPDQLLSLANGGSTNLFGEAKTAYPHLQAFNFDGSGITAANILEKLFDALSGVRQYGKGNVTDAIMSYKHMGNIMKALEVARDYTSKDTKASVYGWTEIEIIGVKGKLTLVAVPEMNDENILLVDWGAIKLHSNGMFERRTAPDGKQFYEVRATTGFKYIVDIRFFGELVVNKPSHCGIIHSISY